MDKKRLKQNLLVVFSLFALGDDTFSLRAIPAEHVENNQPDQHANSQ
jgi:hypothetical protein